HAKHQLEVLVAQRTEQLSQTVAALEQKIAEQQAAEAHIQRLAMFDGLTGLPNRHLLADRATQAIDIAHRGAEPLAVLFL
ncbi:diguanylate cyclase, partial [Acinetobacter baumannii]